MKFACEHCGRSYAVADELRGKTFKMRCKACGHLIVVKGTHAAEPGGKPRGASPRGEATPTPVTIPGTPPGDEPLDRPPPEPEAMPAPGTASAPEPMAIPEENPFVARPISAAGLAHLAAGPPADPSSLPPPPTEKYVDLVIDDEPAGGSPVEAAPQAAGGPAPSSQEAAGSADPFADWETLGEAEKAPAGAGEPGGTSPPAGPAAARPARTSPRREPRIEVSPPRSPAGEGLNPKVLAIAGGVAVAVVAVLLLVYVGRGGTAQGPSAPVEARPAPAASQPSPGPAPAPASAPATPAPVAQPPPGASEPVPALAEPEPGREEEPARRRGEAAPRRPKPAKVAREERRAEPGSPTAPRAEPAAAPAAPQAAPDVSEAQAKAEPPTPEQITRIVSANRRAFEQCVAEASKRDPGLDLTGRQVTLMLTVSPNGRVAYPTIDDVELNQTDLGACIKSAARLMMFPAFEGDPVKVEVPLTLGR